MTGAHYLLRGLALFVIHQLKLEDGLTLRTDYASEWKTHRKSERSEEWEKHFKEIVSKPTCYMLADPLSQPKLLALNDDETMASSKEVTESETIYFNASPCLAGTQSSIIILGSSWYKALTLMCVSWICILPVQTAGQAEQTEGRAIRRCSFQRVADPRLWTVTVKRYVLPSEVSECDTYLEALFGARKRLENQLMDIVKEEAYACSAFREYSELKKTLRCSDGSSLNEFYREDAAQGQNFYRCTASKKIEPYFSGEPTEAVARANCH